MRRLYSWQLLSLLLAGMAAGTPVNDSNQIGRSSDGAAAENATPHGADQAPTTPPPAITSQITVTGEPPLPKLPPGEFAECYERNDLNGPEGPNGPAVVDYRSIDICRAQRVRSLHIVIEKCLNRDRKSAPPVAVLACSELLERKIFLGSDRFYVYVNRAEAYWLQGDKRHALDDYNQAVILAPHNAKNYYNRAVFYLAQTDVGAALRDFDTALSLDPRLVAALLQRAKIHETQNDFSAALMDYSEAIRLKPKTAALWSERGHICLLQHDYGGAIKDEAQAIRLDPTLALAYFFRGAAFGDLGDSPNASSDIDTAVALDPSLDRYISVKGKTATLTLPPF